MRQHRQPSRASSAEDAVIKTLVVGGKIDTFRRGLGLTVEGWARRCKMNAKTMEAICLRQRDPSAKSLWCMVVYGKMNPEILDFEDWGEEGLV